MDGCKIRIAVGSANFKLRRGFTGIGVLIDESAYLESSDTTASDLEVWRALLPSLLTTNGPAVLISTPFARSGLAFELFDKHYGREGSDTLVWATDSCTMNPTLDRAAIDRAYTEDPDHAASDYGRDGRIQFRQDLTSLLVRAALARCVRLGPRELQPQGDRCGLRRCRRRWR